MKAFFFEKKKQKTLLAVADLRPRRA